MAATTLTIQENVPLRDKTTFRVGGPARFFCEVASEAELAEAVSWAHAQNGGGVGLPIFILGGGSNILVADEGFDGLVISMKIKGMDFGAEERGVVSINVGAGDSWDDFVAQTVVRGLCGLENLSGIPGTVGAAPIQNIGAYGAEVAQYIQSVHVYDTHENSWKDLDAQHCGFAYRDSIFKHEKTPAGSPRYIVTSVVFHLKKFVSAETTPVNASYKDLQDYSAAQGALKTPAEIRTAVLSIRAKKMPDIREIGTAGSFFKNPIISEAHFNKLKKDYPEIPFWPAGAGVVKVSLAWILDHVCNYKGVAKGNVGTYKNQALVVVNNFLAKNPATSAEIKEFADTVISLVKEKTSIQIEPEVQYV